MTDLDTATKRRDALMAIQAALIAYDDLPQAYQLPFERVIKRLNDRVLRETRVIHTPVLDALRSRIEGDQS